MAVTFDDVYRMYLLIANRVTPEAQCGWRSELATLTRPRGYAPDSFLGHAFPRGRGLSPVEYLCAGVLFQTFHPRPSAGEKLRPILKRMITLAQDPAWVDALVTCALGGPDALRGFIEQQTGEPWPL